MSAPDTLMRRELLEIPDAVARLNADGACALRAAGAALAALDPGVVVTVARGSSDHAATYFKYLTELTLGVPVASVGPSVASIYGAPLRLSGAACLSVSQSGMSPDIVALARGARAAGALTLAVTNREDGDLAAACAHPLPLHAGPERAVAATKTFVASVAALARLVAEWRGDAALRDALDALPETLAAALAADWSPLEEMLAGAPAAYVLGRGPGFAVSGEAALKLKEVCMMQAAAYSSAEVLHGPVSVVGPGFPVLALACGDAAEGAVASVASDLAGKGATVLATTPAPGATLLPVPRARHPLLDALPLVAAFYATAERAARARGVDPDAPRHLSKVTRTT